MGSVCFCSVSWALVVEGWENLPKTNGSAHDSWGMVVPKRLRKIHRVAIQVVSLQYLPCSSTSSSVPRPAPSVQVQQQIPGTDTVINQVGIMPWPSKGCWAPANPSLGSAGRDLLISAHHPWAAVAWWAINQQVACSPSDPITTKSWLLPSVSGNGSLCGKNPGDFW